MNPSARKQFKLRSQRGSLSILLPAGILVAVVGIGMFAMDISHNVTVRSELQSATDAAALAGAQDLIHKSTENMAETDAMSVAEQNSADGRAVSNTSDNTTVTVLCQTDSSINGGTCKVDGQMTINNMFAKLIDHPTDIVNATSTATGYGSIQGVYADQLFPMAVSLDTLNGHNGKPLYTRKIGDTVQFEINSQQFKNAAFTSFNVKNANANFFNNAVDMMLGFTPVEPGYVPAVDVNDPLYFNNGVASQKDLAKGSYLQAMTDGRTLYLPVMKGDPPYNQNRPCVGFIAVKVKDIKINGKGGQVESFTCELVKGVMKGKPGIITGAGNGGMNNGMNELSAGTVKLSS